VNPNPLADFAHDNTVRYLVNSDFTEATLFFKDGSSLSFVHKARDQRWARPSTDDTTAGKICRALQQFRLNAKHLQLFFEDKSEIEFLDSQMEPPEPKASF